jgi:hypothetical protein
MDSIHFSTALFVWIGTGLITLISLVGHYVVNIGKKNDHAQSATLKVLEVIQLSLARMETSSELRLAQLEKDVAALTNRLNNQRPTIINNNPSQV